ERNRAPGVRAGRPRMSKALNSPLVTRFGRSCLALLAAAVLVAVGGGTRAEVNLPDIGSPADAVLSKSDEAIIGREIMRAIRASGKLVEDPLVNEYINEIG